MKLICVAIPDDFPAIKIKLAQNLAGGIIIAEVRKKLVYTVESQAIVNAEIAALKRATEEAEIIILPIKG